MKNNSNVMMVVWSAVKTFAETKKFMPMCGTFDAGAYGVRYNGAKRVACVHRLMQNETRECMFPQARCRALT
jgi:hypothetical protein